MVGTTTFLLVGAGREAQQRLEARLAERGVTLRHLGALGHLRADAERSYSDLARRAGVTVPSMHATVRQLQDLGAVQRPEGGQGVRARLELTDEGRALLTWAAEQAEAVDAELLVDAPEAEREVLRRWLFAVATSRFAQPPGTPG